MSPFVERAQGFRRVFDHFQFEFTTDLCEGIKIDGMAEGVHWNDNLDSTPGTFVRATIGVDVTGIAQIFAQFTRV